MREFFKNYDFAEDAHAESLRVNPSYKKADIDFEYKIDRKQERMTRYTRAGRVWKQETPGEENWN